MITIEERRVALDNAVTAIHVLAGDMGHDLHAWKTEDMVAKTCCRRCGAQAVVRSYPDGRIWSAGFLTYETPCGTRPGPAKSKKKRGAR